MHDSRRRLECCPGQGIRNACQPGRPLAASIGRRRPKEANAQVRRAT
jgi:hypothetical protein